MMPNSTRWAVAVAAALAAAAGCGGDDDGRAPADAGRDDDAGAVPRDAPGSSDDAGAVVPLHVLVFTRTTGFRHASIEDGVALIQRLAPARGWEVEHTEDPSMFTDAMLDTFAVVVWLSTTGDVLDDAQQAAFERFVRAGGGYVGVHSTSDTEYDWPWYGELAGAYFASHPAIQVATIHVEDRAHPATMHLAETWERTDEWYNFRASPRGSVHVLMSLDEGTYSGGTMGDHPIAWAHEFDGGRAFYTALGHTSESFSEPAFEQHLAGAIDWAAGR